MNRRQALSNINQKLEINKIKISNEKHQILRAENLLSHFEKSFAEQNKSLNYIRDNSHTYVKEISNDNYQIPNMNLDKVGSLYRQGLDHQFFPKGGLLDRIASIIYPKSQLLQNTQIRNRNNVEYFKGYGQNPLNSQINQTIDSDRVVRERTPERIVLKRKNADSFENDHNFKVTVPIDDTPIIISDSPEPQLDPLLNKICIPDLRGTKINKILLRDGCIVAGSGGVLLKYGKNTTLVYETDTTCDIIHVEIIIVSKINYVVALSTERILIFNVNNNHCHRAIDLPRKFQGQIESICRVKNTIYITNTRGSIIYIPSIEWRLGYQDIPNCQYLQRFFPVTLVCNIRFVMLEDSLLYKTRSKELKYLEVIPGVKDVKNIMKCQRTTFLCYSDVSVWLLDEDGNVLKSLSFKYGVKLVDVDKFNVVVVDWNNTIFVHCMVTGHNLGSTVFERSIEGVITAVSILGYKMYIAMDDAVYIIKICTPSL